MILGRQALEGLVIDSNTTIELDLQPISEVDALDLHSNRLEQSGEHW